MRIKNIPVLRGIVNRLSKIRQAKLFTGSAAYWEKRYAKGGNSGRGSYDKLASYKADILNSFVKENNISQVIEFGCGDGNQLTLAAYPSYLGLDVSPSAINNCKEQFKSDSTKKFYLYNSLDFHEHHHAELGLSLDVTYHLIEDDVYHAYLNDLFNAAEKYVIIYAWDVDGKRRGHVLHRKFSTWIAAHKKNWTLLKVNTSIPKDPHACDFYFYKKTGD